MFNVASIRKIEVADAIPRARCIVHTVINFLVSLKGFWEGQVQEGMPGARQPEAREISLR